ncbi:MAG: SURF1 family protein [Xanthobacteraceae bacterium]
MRAPANPAPQRRTGLISAALVTLIAVAVLLGLGTWQLERKRWKEALIDTLDRRVAAAPVELPPRAIWPRLDPARDEFRHVAFRALFAPDQEALVYTSGSAFRTDVSGPGYWVFAPASLPDGAVVVVNRGFVPQGGPQRPGKAQSEPAGSLDIVGVLRWPEARGAFTPADEPDKNLWFVRDPAVIAAAKGWGAVAPFLVEQEAPVPPSGWPRPGPLTVQLRNEHLQYALTWYGLALALVAVFAVWARGARRQAA